MKGYDIFFGLIIVLLGFIIVLSILLMINSFTYQYHSTIEKPCIDNMGDEFIDEMCYDEVYCGAIGFLNRVECNKEAQER